MKKLIITFSLYIITNILLIAQQVELNGNVLIHNSKYNSGSIQYVKDAEVTAEFSTPSLTDINGLFNLKFIGLENGVSINLSVSKAGFEIVNERDLLHVIIGRKSNLNVFLTPIGKLEKARTELYDISLKALTAKHDQLIAQLHRGDKETTSLIQDLKIKFNREIRNRFEAENILNEQLEILKKRLPETIKRLASINLDFSSDLYQAAFALFKNGEIDGAIKKINEVELEKEAQNILSNIKKIEKHISSYEITKEKEEERINQIVESYKLKVDLLELNFFYSKTQDLWKKIIFIQEKVLPQDDIDLFNSYHYYSMTLRSLGEYKRAETILESKLNISLNQFGENHPTTSLLNSSLGLIKKELGKYYEAKGLLERSVFFDINQYGLEDISTLRAISSLAQIYQYIGNYKDAAELLEVVVKNKVKKHGWDNHEVTIDLSNLATVYQSLGEYEKAKNILEKALNSDMKNLKINHPSISTKRSNLAMILKDIGKYKEAKDLLHLSLKTSIENFGENHPKVAKTRSNLAGIYLELDSIKKSLSLYDLALKSNIENLGENHPSVARDWSNIAALYKMGGIPEISKSLLERALASNIQNYGEDHPEVARSRSNLAMVYKDLGDFKKAVVLMNLSLKSDLKNLGETHPIVGIRYGNLAGLYQDLKELDKAYEFYQKAYEIFNSKLGADHSRTISIKRIIETLKK